MRDETLDLERARLRFEEATDFTVAIEEELALVDPGTLELVHRFEELHLASQRDEVLTEAVKGELIASEIEIRSGRAEGFAQMVEHQRERRARLFALAADRGIAMAATGTHPWASYLDQRIIDTPHYRRLEEELGWVAQRNNTWSVHLHMGIRGADRAIAVCDHLRGLLPLLLAASANSPFLDGRDTGLSSVRSEIFTRTFPRCGVPSVFGSWAEYASFIDLLARTNSIVEYTQVWWSVRPHNAFGTVEVRICDAQSSGDASFELAALIAGLVAQSALDHDAGALPPPLGDREVEENLWRAIRYGLGGRMIDFDRGEEVAPRALLERLVEWSDPARRELGIEAPAIESNGSERLRGAVAAGATIEGANPGAVEETARTNAPAGVLEGEG
jgi:carboxylate-amine ligase